MPPLPPVPNVIRIAIECQGNDGHPAVNVVHQVYGGPPPSNADCLSIATKWFQQWETYFTPTQPAQTSLVSVTVTDLASSTGAEATYDNAGTPVPGTSTHGMLPLHTAFLLSKSIARRYRGGHPRSYLPIGTTNDLNDDGDWKDSSWGPWVGDWGLIIGNVIGNSPYGSTNLAEECSVSYYETDYTTTPPTRKRRTTPIVDDIPVDGYRGTKILATQRRRVRKTSRH